MPMQGERSPGHHQQPRLRAVLACPGSIACLQAAQGPRRAGSGQRRGAAGRRRAAGEQSERVSRTGSVVRTVRGRRAVWRDAGGTAGSTAGPEPIQRGRLEQVDHVIGLQGREELQRAVVHVMRCGRRGARPRAPSARRQAAARHRSEELEQRQRLTSVQKRMKVSSSVWLRMPPSSTVDLHASWHQDRGAASSQRAACGGDGRRQAGQRPVPSSQPASGCRQAGRQATEGQPAVPGILQLQATGRGGLTPTQSSAAARRPP